MKAVRMLWLVLVAVMLAGCAASGPRYADAGANQQAVPPASARITVFRTKDSMMYSARSAIVAVDGVKAGTCDYGGFSMLDVTPGKHVIAVDMRLTLGTCELPVEVAGGTSYFFEVRPRAENLVAAVLGSSFGVAGVVAGTAAESAGKQCGGAFSIAPVAEKDVALAKLGDLRETK